VENAVTEELQQGQTENETATRDDFKIKEKVYEMILYGSPALTQFPKSEKYVLAREIRESMYTILKLVITVEKKYYKKTTLGELDTELDILRHFLRLAADERLYPDKKPCLPFRKYEIWSKKLNEIGKMIGGYIKYVK
jgi:hypothetical protein